MKIAIDAMSGDNAPEAVIKGVNLAKKEFPDLEFLLFGNEKAIRQFLEDDKNVKILATSEVIDFHDEPVKAIRRKKDSSMIRAIKAVKDGEADGILSAGNTGALLAGGSLIIGRIKGIDRPALLSTLPTSDGRGFVMLDLGANAENTAKHLETFAVLGSYYAEHVTGVKNPRIALLSNGAEESKGSKMILEAHQLIADLTEINFIGNIESRDILNGKADVVVADGFTGNAVLKAVEGTASLLMRQIKDSIMNGGLTTKIGGALVKGELGKLRTTMSTDSTGGAVLVGVKSPLVKAHGNSNPEAIASAIRQIHKMIASNMTEKLLAHFTEAEKIE